MHTLSAKKKVLIPVVVTAAALVFALVLLFSVRGNADEPTDEIEDLCYQTVSGDSLGSQNTSLRFLFTVGSLDFDSVGFVLSRTNVNPKIGEGGCTEYETTKVYNAVRADGNLVPAPNGRRWVAVKVYGIPNASFDAPIYLKPYVKDGSGVRYGAARAISVEGAFTIPTLKTQIAGFSVANFGGGSVTENLAAAAGTSYDAPPKTPLASHPRVLFTSSDIDDIVATLNNDAHADKVASFRELVDECTDGILPSATNHTGEDKPNGFHNYNESVLSEIRAMAFDYRTTGNVLSGYRAIYALKNYLKTIDIRSMTGDQERQHGNIMYNAACVYDWCYDLLEEDDMRQIVLGVEKKIVTGSNNSGERMEIGFPPKEQQALTGHGSERQLLRDYLSFAIAIYDEYPGWWDFIAGRFYEEFVPVRNAYYEAGYVPQGLSNYVSIRYSSDLWSAWLVKAATGTLPYNATMKQVVRTAYSNVTNGTNRVFEEGDDEGRSGNETLKQMAICGIISGYLFDDDTAMSWAAYSNYSYVDSVSYLILQSGNAVGNKNSRYEDMDLILYNGGWLGQMIAHENWGNGATVKMKIGGRMTGNHDHADAGSFQIYYHGILAGDAGDYDTYGSAGHTKYHQATIAHNSIVLQTGSTVYGQKQPGEVGSLSAWAGSNYQTGTVTGVQYAYADRGETVPTYAYIAGDISAAYVAEAGISRMDRRMLAVYDTDNADVPMYFFVFDDIVSSHSAYTKKFLLHTKNEPTVVGNTVTAIYEDGKLVLQNVTGNSISKSAGCVVGNTDYDQDDEYWGRVEISPSTGRNEDVLLNVTYVCAKDDSPALTATGFSTSEVQGAVIGNTAAVFVKSATRRSTEFSFTAPGDGYLNYYVSGVAEGNWLAVVNGTIIGSATATSEGGFITFSAPAGAAVTLRQGEANIGVDNNLGEDEWGAISFFDLFPQP